MDYDKKDSTLRYKTAQKEIYSVYSARCISNQAQSKNE